MQNRSYQVRYLHHLIQPHKKDLCDKRKKICGQRTRKRFVSGELSRYCKRYQKTGRYCKRWSKNRLSLSSGVNKNEAKI